MDQVDILSAIRQIASERKIDMDEILDAIKEAIRTGYKSAYEIEERELIEVEVEPEAGTILVYMTKTVVDKVTDEKLEISEKEAKEYDEELKIGDTVLVDITAEGDFGRIAAQTARQVITQGLRESEKTAAIEEVKDKVGEIEQVTVQRILQNGDVLCELNRARAIMHKEDRVPTEFYQLGSRLKVLVMSIAEDARGEYVHVSRSAPEFLEALFRMEVPEIDSETVEIVAIAREEGSRSKVAVRSNADGVDAIGSFVGQKGVRINGVMNELKLGRIEEKIDIIPWDEDIHTYLMYSIRPAEGLEVDLNEEEHIATITVPSDQYSLAIGREGQNARLAKKLTGWEIAIKPDKPLEDLRDKEESEEGVESDTTTEEVVEESTESEEETETTEE